MSVTRASQGTSNYLELVTASPWVMTGRAFTICCWAYSTATGYNGWRTFVSTFDGSTGGWEFGQGGGGSGSGGYYLTWQTTGGAYADANIYNVTEVPVTNQWQFVAAQYGTGDGTGDCRLVVSDGPNMPFRVYTAAGTTAMPSSSRKLRILHSSDNSTNGMTGHVAYVRMFEGLLSDGDIARVRDGGPTIPPDLYPRVICAVDLGQGAPYRDIGPKNLGAFTVTGTVNTAYNPPLSAQSPRQPWYMAVISGGSALVKVVTESIQIAETKLNPRGLFRTRTETVDIGESTPNPRGLFRTETETIQIAQTNPNPRGLFRVRTDTIDLSETALKVLGLIRIKTETIDIGEAFVKVLGLVRLKTDGVNIAQTVLNPRGLFRTRTEVVQIGETTPHPRALTRVRTETEQISQTTPNPMAKTRVQTEGVNVSESRLSLRALTRLRTETINIAQTALNLRGLFKVTTDTIQIANTFVKILNGTPVVSGLIHVVSAILKGPQSLHPKRKKAQDNDDDTTNDPE